MNDHHSETRPVSESHGLPTGPGGDRSGRRLSTLAGWPVGSALEYPGRVLDRPIRLSVLGSTGSIGTQTLNVLRRMPPGSFELVGLAAGSNVAALASQAREFRPPVVAIGATADRRRLTAGLPAGTRVLVGSEGLVELAAQSSLVLNAVVGFAGLAATLATLEAGGRLALANKESLVAGGSLVRAARTGTAEIVPVDSEHCALHQCLVGRRSWEVARLIITASGGPFRNISADDLLGITKHDALAHPTWAMGPKITIDSSTLMNKGLEVIEAHELFQVDYDRIEVVVHPQSVVHSMVEMTDGSTLAQLSEPTMEQAIGYALGFPDRLESPTGALDWSRPRNLSFEPADRDRFRALDLAYRAGRLGGTAPACLNAANEVAVAAFLADRIRWVDIAAVVETVLERARLEPPSDLAELVEIDAAARRRAEAAVAGRPAPVR